MGEGRQNQSDPVRIYIKHKPWPDVDQTLLTYACDVRCSDKQRVQHLLPQSAASARCPRLHLYYYLL